MRLCPQDLPNLLSASPKERSDCAGRDVYALCPLQRLDHNGRLLISLQSTGLDRAPKAERRARLPTGAVSASRETEYRTCGRYRKALQRADSPAGEAVQRVD